MATDLAPVTDSDVTASESYQQLLADCHEICNAARVSVLQHMWELGQRISREFAPDDESSYGRKIILSLEQDLAIDRTTLIRARQTYQRFKPGEIGDGSSPMLTWGKLRMVLALPDPMFHAIMKRIRSGELRTDDQVRLAILDLKEAAGETKALPARAARYQLQLAGFDEELLRKPLSTIWNKHDPLHRAMLLTALIPTLDLDREDRPQALEVIGAMRRQLDEYEEGLGRGRES